MSEASDSAPEEAAHRSDKEQAEREARKAIAKEKRKRTAKMMDLEYFLEMVDQKHRYGSSLRRYHEVWKNQDTNQSFFVWLDSGDGKDFELEERPRDRLEREQVRYLSREERQKYLVRINDKGQLVWAKNDELVWTKDELYRDSVNGIVPVDDASPTWKANVLADGHHDTSSDDSDFDSDDGDDENTHAEVQQSKIEGEQYVNEDFHRARGPAKLKHVSPGVLFNHMIRSSMKKGHKWIFVADVSCRLYIGYKQSGSFQHSSFLHGARILCAGVCKVKRGQLRRLSPLSGHYRPSTANFRLFVHSLEDAGCDMSHVSISQSYSVLLGMEAYTKTQKKIKSGEKSVEHRFDKVVRPGKVEAEEEAQQDHSQSAKTEQAYLQKHDSKHQQDSKSKRGMTKRLSNAWSRLTGKTVASDNQGLVDERGTPGTGPEDGIPAPTQADR